VISPQPVSPSSVSTWTKTYCRARRAPTVAWVPRVSLWGTGTSTIQGVIDLIFTAVSSHSAAAPAPPAQAPRAM
jgi:hypothetical protein